METKEIALRVRHTTTNMVTTKFVHLNWVPVRAFILLTSKGYVLLCILPFSRKRCGVIFEIAFDY